MIGKLIGNPQSKQRNSGKSPMLRPPPPGLKSPTHAHLHSFSHPQDREEEGYVSVSSSPGCCTHLSELRLPASLPHSTLEEDPSCRTSKNQRKEVWARRNQEKEEDESDLSQFKDFRAQTERETRKRTMKR